MLHPENRTQFYDISPYDETIVMDVDMLVATDLENHRHFTEININQHQDWKMMEQGTYLHLRPMIQRYKDDCKFFKAKNCAFKHQISRN